MVDRSGPSLSDDELLAALGEALAADHVEPPPAAVADVRLLLTTRPTGGLGRLRGRLTDLRWRLSGWRARLAVAGAAVGLVLVGSGTAFALGAPVPPPVRALAYDIGLPVTPPAVVDVRNAASAVQSDIAPASRTNQAATLRDTQALGHALAGLTPDERISVGSSWRIFAQACRDISSRFGRQSTPHEPGTPVPSCAQSNPLSSTPASPPRGGPPGGEQTPGTGTRTSTPGRGGPPFSGSSPGGRGGGAGGSGGGDGGAGGGGPGAGHGVGSGGAPGGSVQGMRR